MSVRKLLPNFKQSVEAEILSRAETLKEYESTTEAKEQARVDDLFYPGAIHINLAQRIAFCTKNIEELQSFLQIEYVQSQTKPFFIEQQEDFLDILEAYDDKWLKYDIWLYQDILYGLNTNISQDEQQLLILDFADKERLKFERLAAKFSKEQTEHIKYERTRIPENVRIEVWRRDQGKCASCGSRENLEYDHIVPVSRGGSNTARNVELLCEACNRSKGDRIQ